MPGDIVQPFLHDAIDGHLDRGGQALEVHVLAALDFDAVLPLRLLAEVLHGGHYALFFQRGGAEPVDQPPGFFDRLGQDLGALLQIAMRAGWVVFDLGVGRLQEEIRSGHVLHDAVMNFVGDQLPVAFMDIEQPPQHSHLAAQLLLGKLSLSNVEQHSQQGVFAFELDSAQRHADPHFRAIAPARAQFVIVDVPLAHQGAQQFFAFRRHVVKVGRMPLHDFVA